MTPSQRIVLAALSTGDTEYGFGFMPFALIASRAKENGDTIDPAKVRRHVRACARKGWAEFSRGLFTEDGELAGSGYAITFAGRVALEQHSSA
jgi:hypothetical protein